MLNANCLPDIHRDHVFSVPGVYDVLFVTVLECMRSLVSLCVSQLESKITSGGKERTVNYE
ncbi:hypothetical protein CSUI_009301, partial [Cystoisospora suis]